MQKLNIDKQDINIFIQFSYEYRNLTGNTK